MAALRQFIDECLTKAGDASAFAAKGLGDGSRYGLSKVCATRDMMILAGVAWRAGEHLHARLHPEGDDAPRGRIGGQAAGELGMKTPRAGAHAPSVRNARG
jgi:hypothetical protein